MPYYFGEDKPGWEDYMQQQEAGDFAKPLERFTYIEPWEAKASVLQFARTPKPRAPVSPAATPGSPASRPGLLARLFGAKAPPGSTPETPTVGSQAWFENFRLSQKREAQEALERVAEWAAAFRAVGVRRVLMHYDGGNDEGFVHFDAFEMADGRRLAWKDDGASEVARRAAEAAGHTADVSVFQDYGHLDILLDAAIAFLGPGFGTGPYEMFGAITIDCEACTLTDETDPSRTHPDQAPEA